MWKHFRRNVPLDYSYREHIGQGKQSKENQPEQEHAAEQNQVKRETFQQHRQVSGACELNIV